MRVAVLAAHGAARFTFGKTLEGKTCRYREKSNLVTRFKLAKHVLTDPAV
jgi:hypothetical protein